MTDSETPENGSTREIPLVYVGQRMNNAGKLVQAWRRPDQKPDEYFWFNKYKAARVYPGQIWIFTKDDSGWFTGGDNGPRYSGTLPNAECRELSLLDKAAKAEADVNRKAKAEDAAALGGMTIAEFKAQYRKTNYQTRRAMLALLIEEITR